VFRETEHVARMLAQLSNTDGLHVLLVAFRVEHDLPLHVSARVDATENHCAAARPCSQGAASPSAMSVGSCSEGPRRQDLRRDLKTPRPRPTPLGRPTLPAEPIGADDGADAPMLAAHARPSASIGLIPSVCVFSWRSIFAAPCGDRTTSIAPVGD
jgi:hypothetical protein